MCKKNNKIFNIFYDIPEFCFTVVLVAMLFYLFGNMFFSYFTETKKMEKFNNSKPIIEEVLKDSAKNGYVKKSDLIELEEEISKEMKIDVNELNTTATLTPIKAGEEMFIKIKYEYEEIIVMGISELKE